VGPSRDPREAELRPDADSAQLARRLKASDEIARATAATLDTADILDRVLAALFEIFDRAERATASRFFLDPAAFRLIIIGGGEGPWTIGT
jgi:hypothetical protein